MTCERPVVSNGGWSGRGDGYLVAESDVDLCDAARGHGGGGVVAAELFNEGWREGWVGF